MECKADSLVLNAFTTAEFEIQNMKKKFDVFECQRGIDITVDNLMTLDCIRITVGDRWFRYAEMNRFIKHWLKGGSHRLEVLRVVVFDFFIDRLFDGLNARNSDEKMVVLSHYQLAFNGFFEVVRSDGITAGFTFFNGYFWFVVWPKDAENVLYLDSF
uniref:FBA_2 domain-containing protein n=3 Tax=Caenorhabditis tropicalis TaxID=1561998 RepID=A0A1I7U2J6_9PELO